MAPDRYDIRITPRASADLTEICAYVEADSPHHAARLADRLITAIDSLDAMPRRFVVHSHRKRPELIVHAMPVRPFIVYYRIEEKAKTVVILAVRHGSRQQPASFLE